MAKSIEVLSFTSLSENKFEAHGTCDGESFIARTIIYKGEPIFKVQEPGEDDDVKHRNMKDSSWTRGQRIAIARKLKAVRLEGVPSEDKLVELNVKELRTLCKKKGLKGYHSKGVRKDDLVAMLAA